jgi:hypothetical protein
MNRIKTVLALTGAIDQQGARPSLLDKEKESCLDW